ncbi:protein AGENET DOMAIN (AGD)-CONTAINING P1-like [Prosopis cineraria]|uniref:protein AGENET DOMAIN (AGD)-CONTAINING P1-like n=1 Tax=Prosopis cineraria TaxID=364024 RepID=UPI00240F8EC0|nr:protein AGENET DOMAIN (AGD)-CONTAINING P1-like [Prosopis cineraria]
MGIAHFSPSSSPSMSLTRANGFSIGQTVEVINNSPLSYFEATVISRLPNGCYVVEYNSLNDDDEEDNHDNRFFTETVYPNDLRPQPPPLVVSAAGFSLNQKVDAYENEGWWVTTVIGRRDSNYYYVRCVTGDSDIVVHSSQLRVHQDWIGERWVLP